MAVSRDDRDPCAHHPDGRAGRVRNLAGPCGQSCSCAAMAAWRRGAVFRNGAQAVPVSADRLCRNDRPRHRFRRPGGKDYYLFPAYPTMFAVGAAACARLRPWFAGAWIAAALAVFLAAAPAALPILDPPELAKYLDRFHLRPPPDERAAVGAPLTQVFSDEMGWRELESEAARVYRALPEDERAGAAILASNYGEAAAIDVYGETDSLPPAISGNNQYFLWGRAAMTARSSFL
jgi:hypothetical protein